MERIYIPNRNEASSEVTPFLARSCSYLPLPFSSLTLFKRSRTWGSTLTALFSAKIVRQIGIEFREEAPCSVHFIREIFSPYSPGYGWGGYLHHSFSSPDSSELTAPASLSSSDLLIRNLNSANMERWTRPWAQKRVEVENSRPCHIWWAKFKRAACCVNEVEIQEGRNHLQVNRIASRADSQWFSWFRLQDNWTNL